MFEFELNFHNEILEMGMRIRAQVTTILVACLYYSYAFQIESKLNFIPERRPAFLARSTELFGRQPFLRSADTPISMTDSSHGNVSTLKSSVVTVLGKSTSAVVSLSFFIALAIYRDAFMVSLFLGAIGNAILSKILKKIINESRPTVEIEELVGGVHLGKMKSMISPVKPSDGGMPSSHAMSLGFIGATVIIHQHIISQSMWSSIGIPIAVICYAGVSLVYRVQSNLHTVPQVIVGSIIGTLNGALWYTQTLPAVIPLISHILRLEDGAALPLPWLLVPMLVGVLVVGSVERRIGRYLSNKRQSNNKDSSKRE